MSKTITLNLGKERAVLDKTLVRGSSEQSLVQNRSFFPEIGNDVFGHDVLQRTLEVKP